MARAKSLVQLLINIHRMNFNLPFLPDRTEKPRQSGITIMTDRGLGVSETESFTEGNAPYTDFVKMAFGTAALIPSLESKLNIYEASKINCYFGGTLFELFARRDAIEEYWRYLDKFGMEYIEISDAAIRLARAEKLKYINDFSKEFVVIGQVTNFLPVGLFSFDLLLRFISEELEAGARYVIVKESEQIPLYGSGGLATYLSLNPGLVNNQADNIIWDAPEKEQQIELINIFGSNVNLCNVAPNDVLALEAIRLGLHSSTLSTLIAEKK